MKRIFIDTNIIFDVLLKRKNHVASYTIISLCEERVVRGYISQGSLFTLLYVLQKKIGKDAAKAHLTGLMTILHIATCNNEMTIKGLQSKFIDLEDALQYQTALSVDAACIITRNEKHFRESVIPIMTPEKYLK